MRTTKKPRGLAAVEEFCKTILASAYVKGAKPLSGILISQPDTGKSETLLRFHGCKGVVVLSDATGYGLVKNLISDVASGKIHHIVIPDLLRILERSRRVAAEFIATLNAMAEEGFTGALTYNVTVITDRPLHCGFLTALTYDRYRRAKKSWRRIGFASRVIPLFFGYNNEDLEKARQDVLYERNVFEPVEMPVLKPTEVRISDELRLEVKKVADFVARVNRDFTAFRTIRNMLVFVKAHALLHGRDEVTWEDIRFLKSLVPFWFDPIFGNDCDYFILCRLPATGPELVEKLRDIYSQATIYRRLRELRKRGIVKEQNGVYTTTY